MSQLTHLDDAGQAQMVDVTEKNVTQRVAVAEATISMLPETLTMIRAGGHKKGDVFAVARIAGIQAAKKCADLIPLCHPLMLSSIKVDLHSDTANNRVVIRACCKLAGRTGVEMEALTAASVAALTLYDMCKAIDKGMVIGNIRLLEKSGGKSGPWRAEPIPQTEPAPPTGSELQTEPVPRTGSELQTEPVPRTGSELQTEPAPPTESELQTEPAPHSESELQAEPASHVGSKARTKPVSAKGVAV